MFLEDFKPVPLIEFTDGDEWTIGDSFEGTQIFGATGSGKTSGSGKAIALAMLSSGEGRPGYGGLVLTAKPDELVNWVDYLVATGRQKDARIFGIASSEARSEREHRFAGKPDALRRALRNIPVIDSFNFLDYCHRRAPHGASLTLDLVSVLLAALSGGDAAVSTTDPYWNDALRELLTHCIDLAVLATHRVDLRDLIRIVRTAPQSPEEVHTQLRESKLATAPLHLDERLFCVRLLRSADRSITASSPSDRDFQDTAAYWLRDFPALSSRTRSIIVSSFTSKLVGLLRSPLRELMASDDPRHINVRHSADPERTHEGSVIIVDLPIKEFGEVGRLAQVIYKTIWQRSTEKRSVIGKVHRPVFLWVDESQYFVTQYDQLFQQTARSKCAATVFLTQNLPNYYAAIGGQRHQAATESLLGNLQTKIFHANGDPVTNEFAERVFGTRRISETSRTTNEETTGSTRQRVDQPNVRASEFLTLRQGGEGNAYKVEAFVFQGGRAWNDSNAGPTGHLATFDQRTGAVEFE